MKSIFLHCWINKKDISFTFKLEDIFCYLISMWKIYLPVKLWSIFSFLKSLVFKYYFFYFILMKREKINVHLLRKIIISKIMEHLFLLLKLSPLNRTSIPYVRQLTYSY